MTDNTESSSVDASYAQPREIVFRDGAGGETIREIPPFPVPPAPFPVRLLNRFIGEFPRSPEQPGTWLVCGCQAPALQVFRVLPGQDVACTQCDLDGEFLFCGCGVLSRAKFEEGTVHHCLLCGAKTSGRRHPCRQMPSRVSIVLTIAATSCCFCGWGGAGDPAFVEPLDIPADVDNPLATRMVQNVKPLVDQALRSRQIGLEADRAESESIVSNESPLIDRFYGLFRHQGTWIILGVLIVATVLLPFLFNEADGPQGLDGETPQGLVLIRTPPYREGETASPSEIDFEGQEAPVEFFTPPDPPPRESGRGRRIRNSIGKLRSALAEGDLDRLVAAVERLEPMKLTTQETLKAQDLMTRANSVIGLETSITDDIDALENGLRKWASVQELAPAYAEASDLDRQLRGSCERRIDILISSRAWTSAELLTSKLADMELWGSFAAEQEEKLRLSRHREYLDQAESLLPHEGILVLERHPPPSELVEEHGALLEQLRSSLETQDQDTPIIQFTEGDYDRNRPLRLEFQVTDDYHRKIELAASVAIRVERDHSFRDLEGAVQWRGGDRYLVLVPESVHEGRRIDLRFFARDVSGHLATCDVRGFGKLNRRVRATNC